MVGRGALYGSDSSLDHFQHHVLVNETHNTYAEYNINLESLTFLERFGIKTEKIAIRLLPLSNLGH